VGGGGCHGNDGKTQEAGQMNRTLHTYLELE
jgi:hypothetical protein